MLAVRGSTSPRRLVYWLTLPLPRPFETLIAKVGIVVLCHVLFRLLLPGPVPNFISDIFYLANAYLHYGLVTTIQSHDNIYRRYDDLQRELDRLEQTTTHQGVCTDDDYCEQFD